LPEDRKFSIATDGTEAAMSDDRTGIFIRGKITGRSKVNIKKILFLR
jgi:hypothetical protein